MTLLAGSPRSVLKSFSVRHCERLVAGEGDSCWESEECGGSGVTRQGKVAVRESAGSLRALAPRVGRDSQLSGDWGVEVRQPSLRRWIRFARQLALFLVAGVPAFTAALLTNIFLTEKLQWPKPIAYVPVLALQMTINFFACRAFVFGRDAQRSVVHQYVHFMSGNAVIRLSEWLLYTILVELTHIYYVGVQLGCIAVFAVVKFRFAESILGRRKRRITSAG